MSLPKKTQLKLPRLSNEAYERAEALASYSFDTCPTCKSKPIEVAPGIYGWENGTYTLDGHELDCDCDTQRLLYRHYLAANIGDQYQRLNWREFYGSSEAVDLVSLYLDSWTSAKNNGIGLEFYSPETGSGKTFAATHIGKELIKKGEKVYFTPFLDFINILSATDRIEQEERLFKTTVLILDEVRPATTMIQNTFFSNRFEELIRNRTNFNRVTIMTTNLEPGELRYEYPRPYSLLEAKQKRIKMSGDDARIGERKMRNQELFMNNEIEPIY